MSAWLMVRKRSHREPLRGEELQEFVERPVSFVKKVKLKELAKAEKTAGIIDMIKRPIPRARRWVPPR